MQRTREGKTAGLALQETACCSQAGNDVAYLKQSPTCRHGRDPAIILAMHVSILTQPCARAPIPNLFPSPCACLRRCRRSSSRGWEPPFCGRRRVFAVPALTALAAGWQPVPLCSQSTQVEPCCAVWCCSALMQLVVSQLVATAS